MQNGSYSTETAAVPAIDIRPLRGVFINTEAASCSIFESGRMVYQCIEASPVYTLAYLSLDTLDLEYLDNHGRARRIDGAEIEGHAEGDQFDFWVFNWHFYTMATVRPDIIARLQGFKFTVVLELAPGDPLKLVPPGVFDGYIALDPAAVATDQIFPFPRPLEGVPRVPHRVPRDIPIIASFGFGTPGKGFELLVEAVNHEFDNAMVRINVPSGTYTGLSADAHRSYIKYLEKVCERIAKPGICVQFSHDFMSPEQLVDWCADNDLNCFMYTRCQPGLSATTDQAIISGQPLLTLSNDTFRHIHPYIPPYPVTSLRQALETSTSAVREMQENWSRSAFNDTFHEMLTKYDLLSADQIKLSARKPKRLLSKIILLVHKFGDVGQDVTDYSVRAANAIGRSGEFEVVRLRYGNLADVQIYAAHLWPAGIVLLDVPAVEAAAAALDLEVSANFLVFLHLGADERMALGSGKLTILPRRPIIPFFTVNVTLRPDAPSIWLVGFATETSNLRVMLEKIASDSPNLPVSLEAPSALQHRLQDRVDDIRKSAPSTAALSVTIRSLPARDDGLVQALAAEFGYVFFYDAARADELDGLVALAMATPRPVLFTRASPFPFYDDLCSFVEDGSIRDIQELGIKPQIRSVYEFGEWRFFSQIHSAVSEGAGTLAAVRAVRARLRRGWKAGLAAARRRAIELEEGNRFVRAAYLMILERDPDPQGGALMLQALMSGRSKENILDTLRESEEALTLAKGRTADTAAFELSALDEAILAPVLALDGSEFVRGAYLTVLGREPDAEGGANFLALIEGGRSKLEVIKALGSSDEGRMVEAQEEAPDPAVWTYPVTVRAAADRLLAAEGAEFVRLAHQTTLGRRPDPDETVHCLALLERSGSKAEILVPLCASEEGRRWVEAQQFSMAVSPAGALLTSGGSEFVRLAYRTVLGREPDTEGARAFLDLLDQSGSKAAVLRGLQESDEGRLRAQTTTPASPVTVDTLLTLDGLEFVRTMYLAILGRAADEEGIRHHSSLLNEGMSREAMMISVRFSAEGRAFDAELPGLAALMRRRKLAASDHDVGRDPDLIRRLMSDVRDQLSSLKEEIDAPAALEFASYSVEGLERAPPPATPSVSQTQTAPPPATASHAVFVLVGSTEGSDQELSPFTKGFALAWREQYGDVRLVLWNSHAKAFHRVQRSDMRRWGLSPIREKDSGDAEVASDPVLRMDTSSCRPGDWILLPDDPAVYDLEEDLLGVNLLMAAKRVGLQRAAVFHGADPLRSTPSIGAAAYESYMQALLLADLVVPTTVRAKNDLISFFVQHQLAELLPRIKKASPPQNQWDGQLSPAWSEYVRRVDGLLVDTANAARSFRGLYYLSKTPNQAGVTFSSSLSGALSAAGVAVTPVRWDGEQLALQLEEWADAADAAGVSWIDPRLARSPSWLLVPDRIDDSLAGSILEFAAARGLRVATVLHERAAEGVADSKADLDEAALEALTRFDKVFTVSQARYWELYGALLKWRGKVNSAEHRFRVLETPNEVLGVSRPAGARLSSCGGSRVLVWMADLDPSRFDSVVEAVARAIKRAPGRLQFTFVGCLLDADGPAGVAARDKIRTLPAACWRPAIGLAERFEEVDLTFCTDVEASDAWVVEQSLWRCVPCVAHGDTEQPAPPGLVFVDMNHAMGLTEALVKLSDPQWLRVLANEVAAAPVKSWNAYALEIAVELATDQLIDGIERAEVTEGPNVYAMLPALQKRPTLSLCISTYNRAGWLALNLRNIFSQVQGERPDLEVLVVDNASVDGTAEVVRPYLSRSDFRYFRNARNVGMLGNLAVTAQKAKGEYIWIIGDDDLTRAGAIDSVISAIEEHPAIGLVYLNYGYSSEANPESIVDLPAFLGGYNILEPPCPNVLGDVVSLATKNENFYTAIYSHVYRRDHGLRAYCQDTSERIFSTMLSCIPTAYYVLNYMPKVPAYWIGEPCLVVNSNVSWAPYGPLFDLEQLPRTWDLAERMGADPVEVDRRRANRLWLVEMMWRDIFENDAAGNSPYFSASRVLMRLKHLPKIDQYVPEMKAIYQRAYDAGHAAAGIVPSELFSAWPDPLSK